MDESTHSNQHMLRHSAEQMEVESALEHLHVLFSAEEKFYPCCQDYISGTHLLPSEASDRMNESWRRKLCEWMYQVVDHFGFDREVVAIALSYLDRSVASLNEDETPRPVIVKKEFQRHAIASLYMAVKTHGQTENFEYPRRKLKVEAFVQLSRGVFSVETIEATEREILARLDWRVNPPTSLRFTSYLLKLLPSWNVEGDYMPFHRAKNLLFELSRYFSELSACISKASFHFTSSMISYASVLCALEVLVNKVDIPRDNHALLLTIIKDQFGLFPEAQEVQNARILLRSLCPTMFQEGAELPAEFQACNDTSSNAEDSQMGKSSPVSVADRGDASPSQSRKRSRQC